MQLVDWFGSSWTALGSSCGVFFGMSCAGLCLVLHDVVESSGCLSEGHQFRIG